MQALDSEADQAFETHDSCTNSSKLPQKKLPF